MSTAKIKQLSIILSSLLQLSDRLKIRKWQQFWNHTEFAPKFNVPVNFVALDQCYLNFVILTDIQYKMQNAFILSQYPNLSQSPLYYI